MESAFKTPQKSHIISNHTRYYCGKFTVGERERDMESDDKVSNGWKVRIDGREDEQQQFAEDIYQKWSTEVCL